MKHRETATHTFFRTLGLTLGIGLLLAVAPWVACRTAFVSYRSICEDAGGLYVEIADVQQVCSMPTAATPCPPHFTLRSPGECDATSLSGLACRAAP